MRGLLLYNPTATSTNARVRDAVTNILAEAFDLQVQPTRARGHATQIAAHAVRDGIEIVFSLGGDGTANETLQALAGTDVVFAHVPGGGTNVMARALGMPNDARLASVEYCELAQDEAPSIGLGKADERWFACIAGLGFDAAIVKRVEDRPRLKHFARQLGFVWCGLTEWFEDGAGLANQIEVVLPDRSAQVPSNDRSSIAIIGNADPYTYLGAMSMRITPEARFSSGIDLVTVNPETTGQLVRTISRAFRGGKHIGDDLVRHWHDLQDVTLRSPQPLPLMVDGDHVGHRTEVRFTAVPAALRVLGHRTA